MVSQELKGVGSLGLNFDSDDDSHLLRPRHVPRSAPGVVYTVNPPEPPETCWRAHDAVEGAQRAEEHSTSRRQSRGRSSGLFASGAQVCSTCPFRAVCFQIRCLESPKVERLQLNQNMGAQVQSRDRVGREVCSLHYPTDRCVPALRAGAVGSGGHLDRSALTLWARVRGTRQVCFLFWAWDGVWANSESS